MTTTWETQTVTRVRVERDRNGDPVGEPIESPIDGCLVYPSDGNAAGANEIQDGQFDRVTVGKTLVAPFGVDIKADDRFKVDDSGVVWDVVGDVAAWTSPFTDWHPGTVVALRRYEG